LWARLLNQSGSQVYVLALNVRGSRHEGNLISVLACGDSQMNLQALPIRNNLRNPNDLTRLASGGNSDERTADQGLSRWSC
jgi:hypothetical protein